MGNPWALTRAGGFSLRSAWAAIPGNTKTKPGRLRVQWVPEQVVKGVANDIPVAGYDTHMTNFLRLWSSEAVDSFDFQAFNEGDYYEAVREKMHLRDN